MSRVFIIAEAGVNHDGSIDDARRMVDVAADAGADAVKFQTFRADQLVTKRAAKAAYQVANTGEDGGQMEMLRRLELSHGDHAMLADHCRARGVRFMSTAFDMESLTLLAGMDMPALKIPSGDITWGPMLLAAARLGMPMLVSTGMSTLEDIRQALSVIAFGSTREGEPLGRYDLGLALKSKAGRAALKEKVTLLHCTTQYPAPLTAVNLKAMDLIASTFGLPVGYSDHTLGITVPIAAVARGATVIEKHFTLDRSRHGPDHAASLEPSELAEMVKAIRDVEIALGRPEKKPTVAERANLRVARRCVVAARRISFDETLTLEMLTAKRPSDGRSPMAIWSMLGRPAYRDYEPDDIIE